TKTRIRRVSAIGSALIVGIAASLAMGQPAYAATVTVDTTDDTVAADGATSLREAIDLANAAGSDTTIELQAGATYEFDLCGGATEEDNASGDLDYTASGAHCPSTETARSSNRPAPASACSTTPTAPRP